MVKDWESFSCLDCIRRSREIFQHHFAMTLLGSIRAEGSRDSEHAPQLEVRPMVQGVADEAGHAFRVGEKTLLIAGRADEFIVPAAGSHGAPLVLDHTQHEPPDVGEGAVFRDFLRAQVAMVINDGLVRGDAVVQPFRGLGTQQEIFAHELHHHGPPKVGFGIVP